MERLSKKYIHDFIFKQKCIPWRLIKLPKSSGLEEWWIRCQVRVMSKFILQNILLENIFTGGFNGDKQFDYEHTPIEKWHPNYLLKESPHVKFLQQFKNIHEATMEEFKKSEYFHFATKDIRIYGDFFGISDEERLADRGNAFLSLYRAIRDKTNGKDYIFLPGDCYEMNCFMKVSKIPNSEFYLIREGHHRFAAYYVLGYKIVKARVM